MRSHSPLIQFHTHLQQQLNIKTVIIALELISHLYGFTVSCTQMSCFRTLSSSEALLHMILYFKLCTVCVYVHGFTAKDSWMCLLAHVTRISYFSLMSASDPVFMNPAHMRLEIIYCHLLIEYSRCFYCVCVVMQHLYFRGYVRCSIPLYSIDFCNI